MTSKCEIDACEFEFPESQETCANCGKYAGPPNVRAATSKEEEEALEIRYKNALDHAANNGALTLLTAFEEAVKNSMAVVACDFDVVRNLLMKDHFLYNNYHMAVAARFVNPSEEYYRRRKMVDSYFFPGYEKQMVFGCLSLDGIGIKNYGDFFLELSDYAVKLRSTLLEENVFEFAKKRQPVLKDDLTPNPVPPGYRASWQQRHKLAVAKVAHQISADTTSAEFAHLLRSDGKNKHEDNFIEVHIYGTFSGRAIKSVTSRVPAGNLYQDMQIALLENILSESGRVWKRL